MLSLANFYLIMGAIINMRGTETALKKGNMFPLLTDFWKDPSWRDSVVYFCLELVLISLTKTMMKDVRWQAFFPLLRRDEDETTRSINHNYDYINMQFLWRNKTRLKSI